jgi:OOP family OmpA-OmpF porin
MMDGLQRHLRGLAPILAIGLLASCAQETVPPTQAAASLAPQAATSMAPHLASAWYQVLFNTNSSAIDERGRMIVRTVAYVVANDGTTRVTVIGKTDRVGAPPANLALAQRRAEAIRDALVDTGVPAARIDTSWLGEGKPEVTTADDVAEPRNRVVDVTVVQVPR